MARYSKKGGKYNISGSTFSQLMGTRAQVWHGTAYKTSGGLTKKDLFQNKAGRIVSKHKHASAKKDNRLVKSGYGTKKGKFGYVKLSKKTKKMRGGSPYGNSFSPSTFDGSGIDGQGITDYNSLGSVGVQMAAGMAGGRRRKGGSIYGNSLSPAMFDGSGIDGQGITDYGNSGSVGVQMEAGMAGGKRRSLAGGKSRKRRGGAPYGNSFSPSAFDGIDGQGITDYNASGSNSVQMAAGMAGGKRRKRRGGTMKQSDLFPMMPGSPLNSALGAAM